MLKGANKAQIIAVFTIVALLCTSVIFTMSSPTKVFAAANVKAGAIYFNGFGETHHDTWICNGRLVKSYPERTPIWGYYSNSVSYMETEIDAAVNGGLSYFAFLFYPALDSQSDGNYKTNPRNVCFDNYYNASNKSDIEWCVYFANHAPYQPDVAYWKQIIDWMCVQWGNGYFRDSNYLLVDGKPVIIVFDKNNFPDEVKTYLRNKIAAQGFPGVYLLCKDRYASGSTAWDGHTEYNIQIGTGEKTQAELRAINMDFLETGTPTDKVLAFCENNWDNRAWTDTPSRWYIDRNAVEFETNLTGVVNWMTSHSGSTSMLSNLLLINAWNENGEGGYLMPDVCEQDDHLKAINKVINGVPYTRCTPAYGIPVGTTQAENMGKGTTYVNEASGGASGGYRTKLNALNEEGAIWGTYTGGNGTYNINVSYYDESSGQATSKLFISGKEIGSWTYSYNDNTYHTKTFANVSLKNRDVIKIISYSDSGEYARIDTVTVAGQGATPTPIPGGGTVYEAEAGIRGGAATIVSSPSASGGQAIGGMTTVGSYVQVGNVDGGSGGTKTLVIRYSCAYTSNKSLSLYVNGVDVEQVIFTPTGSWDTFQDKTVNIALNADTGNTIKLQLDASDAKTVNIDKFTVN